MMWKEQREQRNKRSNFPFEYRTIAHLPAAHIAGVQGYFVNPFFMGGPVYWMPKFDFLKFLASLIPTKKGERLPSRETERFGGCYKRLDSCNP
jgi:hypothetical protein